MIKVFNLKNQIPNGEMTTKLNQFMTDEYSGAIGEDCATTSSSFGTGYFIISGVLFHNDESLSFTPETGKISSLVYDLSENPTGILDNPTLVTIENINATVTESNWTFDGKTTILGQAILSSNKYYLPIWGTSELLQHKDKSDMTQYLSSIAAATLQHNIDKIVQYGTEDPNLRTDLIEEEGAIYFKIVG